jgi:hypothetical protein
MSMTDTDAFNIGRTYFDWLDSIARRHGLIIGVPDNEIPPLGF